MTDKLSAGVLLWDVDKSGVLVVFLAHMGGPFWARKDQGAWSLPKGEHDPAEPAMHTARREFKEEIGADVPDVELSSLGEFKQSSGKIITAFAGRCHHTDVAFVASNTFELEWPKGSGKIIEFAEIDKAEWVPSRIAKTKVVKGQVPIIEALETTLRSANTEFRDGEPEPEALF